MHARVEVGGEIGGYAVKDRLGEGGMGTVFLAEQAGTGQLVALKILQAELAQDQEFRRRFERESQYASSLNHPNITRVIEFGEADGVEFMAMEYVPGHDLTVELAAGRIATGRAIEILGQVASALDAVHSAGIFHRDVKPANILVNDDEGTGAPRCWLTDFGLSKHPSQDSSPLTNAGFFVGTCHYVAPEQILADRDLDHRVDVYSLGCVLYECLAGDPPFMRPREEQVLYAHIQDAPPKISQVRPDLPAGVDAVLDKALAKKPEERYDSCGELIAAARAVLPMDEEEVEAGPPPAPDAAPVSSDCLRLRVTAGNAEGSEIQVREEFVIGRQAPEEGQLGQDAEISRHHARIARSNGTFIIEDLGSTNGTFVNGRRISKPELLSPGDRIQVGATTLVVQVSVPAAAAAAAASGPDADTRSSSHMIMPEPPTEASPPPLSLHLSFDPAAGEVTLRLDDESDPVRLVYDNGRWRLAPKDSPG
ncbi:MAG TPA: FHA domain-containing serine/threonine-protein kinase [Thermoleophilaceae bacterium]